MNQKLVKKILKENKEAFEILEHYDKTNELLIGRKRIDITLDLRLIKKLQEIKKKTGQSISRIIEDCLKKCLNIKKSPPL